MATSRRIIASITAVALGCGALTVLSGCSPEQLIQDAVENAIQDQTGVDIDVNTDASGSATMPADWPAEVPVVSGNIMVAGSIGSGTDKTWTVQITVPDVASGYDEAKNLLLGAGFTASMDMTGDGTWTGMFDNGNYSVIVTGTDDGTDTYVGYLVGSTSSTG